MKTAVHDAAGITGSKLVTNPIAAAIIDGVVLAVVIFVVVRGSGFTELSL